MTLKISVSNDFHLFSENKPWYSVCFGANCGVADTKAKAQTAPDGNGNENDDSLHDENHDNDNDDDDDEIMMLRDNV